jgi:hypothetical protein
MPRGDPLNAPAIGMARSLHGMSRRKFSIGKSSLSIDAYFVVDAAYIAARCMLFSGIAPQISASCRRLASRDVKLGNDRGRLISTGARRAHSARRASGWHGTRVNCEARS